MGFESESIGAFLSAVASENVTPAGGTCAAVVGAVGVSLCEMACIHTISTEAHTGIESELVETGDKLASQREHLLQLADSDAAVVEDFLDTFDNNRTEIKRATGIPLTIAESCLHVLNSARVVTAKGKENVLPDAMNGVFITDAALRAALFTVRTNTEYVNDISFVEKINQRATEIESSAEKTLAEIRSDSTF